MSDASSVVVTEMVIYSLHQKLKPAFARFYWGRTGLSSFKPNGSGNIKTACWQASVGRIMI
jgi:hypothetical protein